MQTILFLTGTIAPAEGTPLLHRCAVRDRIADYQEALAFYIGLLRRGVFQRIVFVENSGYGVSPLESVVAQAGAVERVELISYRAPPVRENESRLLSEFHLIEHGLSAARTLREAGEAAIWKVTGRYIVRNLATILGRSPPGMDLYVHCRAFPKPYIDFMITGYALSAAPEILARLTRGNVHSRDYMRWLRQGIDGDLLDGFKVSRRLPVIPDLRGRRGKDGVSYGRVDHRAKYLMRQAVDRVCPSLWI